jgi:hypothetical protein
VQLDFDADTHTYRLDGREVPSVTAVLAPLIDFDGIPAAVLETARQRGSYVDEACDLIDAGTLDWQTVDPDHVEYVAGYQNWLEDTAATVVANQLRVVSPSLRFAGTLDMLAEINGKLSVIDRKASHVPPPSVGPQTAAYAHAAQEQFGHRIRHRYCLHLHPTHPRGYRLTALTDSTDWSVFVSALNIHKWKQKHAV